MSHRGVAKTRDPVVMLITSQPDVYDVTTVRHVTGVASCSLPPTTLVTLGSHSQVPEMCIRGRARRERSGLRQQQRAQHRKNRVTRRDVTLAKSRNFQIHGSCNQRTLAATSESAQPVLGRRAGCMHRASTCRTHPPAALPCQMSAWAVRACDSNHVCTGGKQKVPCTRRIAGIVLFHGLPSQTVLSICLPSQF